VTFANATSGEVSTCTYEPAKRLTGVDGVGYTWDDNGNLLDDGVRTYDYDNANRLIAVVSGTLTTTYIYNGDGHRMAKAKNGVTTSYVVAVLGLSQVLVETTGGDSILYLYGHDLLGEKDDTWQWHLGDGLGSVRQLIDSGGGVSLAQGYTPFGVPLWSEGGGTTGYGFTGERWEAYSELLFLRARYYHPGTGRFISQDSWAGSAYRPQTMNRWSYANGDPINLTDPTGHEGKKLWEITAGESVFWAKMLHGQVGLIRICPLNTDDGQCATDTVNDLLTD
jgi:RHS repeat-associated protein